jgi:hypothetical protein
VLATVNDAFGAALRSLSRSLTAAPRDALAARKAGTEKRRRQAEPRNDRRLVNRSTRRLRLFAVTKNIDTLRWDDCCAERKRHVSIGAYLLGGPLPGRRHAVKAVSREAGARNVRQP